MKTVREMMEFLSHCNGDDYVIPCSWFDDDTCETEVAVRIVDHNSSDMIDAINWTLEDSDED